MPNINESRRLVIKMGSALLVDETSGTIHRKRLKHLAQDVAKIKANGILKHELIQEPVLLKFVKILKKNKVVHLE